jgi:hypothetical protein
MKENPCRIKGAGWPFLNILGSAMVEMVAVPANSPNNQWTVLETFVAELGREPELPHSTRGDNHSEDDELGNYWLRRRNRGEEWASF